MDSSPVDREVPADPWSGLTELERRPLRGARRVVAQRLGESWRTAVAVTLHRDLDVSNLSRGRERDGTGWLDLLLHATARALRAHPPFNAIFNGDVHRVFAEINIGFAVDTPRGLVVPVLREVESKSVPEVARARRTATDLVVGWRHSVTDLVGGTFTVTNLGTLGIDFFTPIINPPQVAILGVGRLRRQAVDWSLVGTPQVRTLMPVSLTIDHRVLDGADGARFLQTLQQLLEGTPD